ncbi:MAG TPA: hypothetical protein IAC52_01090 [Candidatus Enteromonas pullicola]|uniref:Uncharacterized protein n=1 Tax=Candidatus Alloenteromonas pullicola TaxID=2840784 RepID=A0A9D1LN16_9FIRM|nr:hypothetical protein [Candidatus Enteromonas pullicola]
MSELKGQLLGILLTLVAFAAVGTVMVSALSSTSDAISEKVSNETSLIASMGE